MTRRSSAAPGAATPPSRQLSDLVLDSMMSGANKYSAEEFASMMQAKLISAVDAGPAAHQTAPPAERGTGSAGRSRRGSAAAPADPAPTMDQVWSNISGGSGPSSGAAVEAPIGTLRSRSLGRGVSTGLSLPQVFGSGAMPSLPVLTQGSIERLVSLHGDGSRKNAGEWLELLMSNQGSGGGGGGGGGIQPTLSATMALETTARAMFGSGRVAATKKTPAAPAASKTTAAALAAAKKALAEKPAARGTKRGRGAAAELPVITLPPKKKGRKKKGEVDTETEEEKELRALERQRKNRESAARSHQRKAKQTEELTRELSAAKKKILALERTVSTLRKELGRGSGSVGSPRSPKSLKGVSRQASGRSAGGK